MNKRQKIVLWAGIIVFVLIGLEAPTHMVGGTVHETKRGLFRGHASVVGATREVDLVQLCTYWVMTVVVTGGLIYTLKDSKPKAEQKQ